MRRLSRFDTATSPAARLSSNVPPRPRAGTDPFRLKKTIEDMHRIVASLDAEIMLEENQARVHDQSHYTYPTTAKSMRQRRDNLMLTIAALEAKLPSNNQRAEAAGEIIDAA